MQIGNQDPLGILECTSIRIRTECDVVGLADIKLCMYAGPPLPAHKIASSLPGTQNTSHARSLSCTPRAGSVQSLAAYRENGAGRLEAGAAGLSGVSGILIHLMVTSVQGSNMAV